jgi:predicted GNAT family acetyltransferase
LADPQKFRYEIALAREGLTAASDSSLTTRQLDAFDRDELATLILDAYLGTIDYEGETIVEAGEAIDEWLDDEPLLSDSYAAFDGDTIASATLAMMLDDEPFISIVMTHPSYKRKGYGTAVVRATLDSLGDKGHEKVVFYITEGNTASESLFYNLGATRVEEP